MCITYNSKTFKTLKKAKFRTESPIKLLNICAWKTFLVYSCFWLTSFEEEILQKINLFPSLIACKKSSFICVSSRSKSSSYIYIIQLYRYPVVWYQNVFFYLPHWILWRNSATNHNRMYLFDYQCLFSMRIDKLWARCIHWVL